jgi:serine/threonine protein kinase
MPSPSKIKGRYEIKGRLGEGGMGIVFRAYDIPVGRDVALKTLPEFSDPSALQLFYKEIDVLKSMSHPNIVEIFDKGEFEEGGQVKPFFVMPLLPGKPLDELIHKTSRLTVERVVDIMTQACRGLQAAHERGLIHRDLKPSNIFVMDDYSVKIIDFGVAHSIDSRSRSSGFQKGTLLYMAPEQVQFKPVSAQSDIFSLAVVCYEALSRRQPFRGNTEGEIVQAILKSIPPPASDVNPAVSHLISRVVHKAMAKQPWNRFDTVREFGETLQKALRNEPIELFDPARFKPRLDRANHAFENGDHQFASEIVTELEAEGNVDPQITLLRVQIEQVIRQKTIAQLLESARARYEEEEDPLALQKIQEILQLDPNNALALSFKGKIDERRSERQIEKWLRLARQHVDNHSYNHAREAIESVLQLRPRDSRATRLLTDIQKEEQAYLRLRQEKDKFYQSALNAWKNGDVSHALSQMVLVLDLDRSAPDTSSPDLSGSYQNFYNKVRSEHDSMNNGYAKARRHLADQEFKEAHKTCDEFLAKYPGQALFQALKFDIAEQERQQLSSFIADVGRRVDAEPDLDAKVNILREALAAHPGEAHFEGSLKVTSDKRDLVNAIVARSRFHEENGQINDALNDLETIRTIYAPYPGLHFEIDRLKKRQQQQIKDVTKASWVEQIDRQLESGEHKRSLELLQKAQAEFPDDAEFAELQNRAQQGFERASEAEQLCARGQALYEQGEFENGIESIRKAYLLVGNNPAIRVALRDRLIERAQSLLEKDWRSAESMANEALELDPTSALARSFRAQAQDRKREEFVADCALRARRLQAAEDVEGAAAEVEKGLALYPAEPRLTMLRDSLKKEVSQSQWRQTRAGDLEQLRALQRNAERSTNPEDLESISERTRNLAVRYPSQADIQSIAREVDRIVEARGGPAPGHGPVPSTFLERLRKRLTPFGERKGRELKHQRVANTEVSQKEARDRKETPIQHSFREVDGFFRQVERKMLAFARPSGKWSAVRLGAVGGSIVLIAVIGYLIVRTTRVHKNGAVPAEVRQYVQIRPDPADSTITSDGKPLTGGAAAAGATVEVAHLGYRTKRALVQQESDGKIVLEPEPVHVSIQTSAKSGTVELDGRKISDLSQGSLDEFSLTPDGNSHKLTVIGQGKQLFAVDFQAVPGSRPQVTVLAANDLLVVTSLGDRATVYGGNLPKSVQIGDQNIAVLPSGTDFNLSEQNREISFGEGNERRSLVIDASNAPALVAHSLTTEGQLTLTTNVEGATLTVDGEPVRRQKRGWLITGLVGPHNFAISVEGYQSQAWTMTLQRGQSVKRNVVLVPKLQPPALSSLRITGGTPGAEVVLDGSPVGPIDANGNFERPHALTAAKHTVAISKPNYETRIFDATPPNPPSEVHLQNAALIAWAVLEFQTTARNIAITYRRVGDAQFHDANSSSKIPLPPGQYEIVAEAPGFQRFSTQLSLGSQNVTVSVKLVPILDYELLDPNQITHEGPWIRSKNPGKFVYLKPGFLQANLVFAKPGKTLFGGKKVEWVIEAPEEHIRMQYDLDGQGLKRKLVVGGEASDEKEVKVNTVSAEQANSLSVHVRVDGVHVTITNDRGVVLDDYTAQGHDFSRARIGIKTDSQFRVRSDNQ